MIADWTTHWRVFESASLDPDVALLIDPDKFLEDVSGRYARPYFAAISDLMVAMVTGNHAQQQDALFALNEVIRQTMGVAEVLGASITLQATAKVAREEGAVLRADRAQMLAFEDAVVQNVLPRVTLTEAGQDMVDRTPKTIRAAAERTWRRISQLYAEGHNVAFVRSAEAAVTKRAQAFISHAIAEGIPEAAAGRGIKMAVDEVRKRTAEWSESYSRMAFRTNLNTAVTAGRFRTVQDPDVAKFIPAFRFTTARDIDVRSNHAPGDGMILKITNPAWGMVAPPLEWNCRCRVDNMPLPMLRRMGRLDKNGDVIESQVPKGLQPGEGFRHEGRPDLFLATEVGS